MSLKNSRYYITENTLSNTTMIITFSCFYCITSHNNTLLYTLLWEVWCTKEWVTDYFAWMGFVSADQHNRCSGQMFDIVMTGFAMNVYYCLLKIAVCCSCSVVKNTYLLYNEKVSFVFMLTQKQNLHGICLSSVKPVCQYLTLTNHSPEADTTDSNLYTH